MVLTSVAIYSKKNRLSVHLNIYSFSCKCLIDEKTQDKK